MIFKKTIKSDIKPKRIKNFLNQKRDTVNITRLPHESLVIVMACYHHAQILPKALKSIMNRVVDKYLSIILIVYNRINLIRKTLLSINQQSVLPAEVIISDDGSIEDIPAGTSDRIPEFNFIIKYIRQEDQGFRAVKCRNNGIRESSGEYLVFFD